MGFKFGYSSKGGDDFEVWVSGIEGESKEAIKEMEKEAAEIVKKHVVANLNKHRRVLAERYKGRPAMADDVIISRRKDRYGDLYLRVMGDEKTGTLWHLVNDGNLHSRPTHFMDGALARLDGDIDRLWDEILGGK